MAQREVASQNAAAEESLLSGSDDEQVDLEVVSAVEAVIAEDAAGESREEE
jgi:hypothetical protein